MKKLWNNLRPVAGNFAIGQTTPVIKQHMLQQNDVIKFGKVQFIVRDMNLRNANVTKVCA